MFIYQDLIRDVIASRPAAGSKGRRFTATDTNIEYYDDGTTWQAISLASAQLVGSIPESQVTSLTADLAAKAPLASPALTGTPTAPTPSTADNSTKIATTAYVQAQGYGVGGFASPLTTKGDVHTYSTSDARLAVGTNGQRLVADSAQATGLKWDNDPFMVVCYRSGKPDAGEVLCDFIPAIAGSFPTSLTGSTVRIGTNPTATAVYTFSKNGTSFGTLSISTSGVATWTSASGASFNGTTDYCTITGPSSQDATLAGVGICLKGSHS